MTGKRTSAQPTTSDVGIGSKGHDFFLDFFYKFEDFIVRLMKTGWISTEVVESCWTTFSESWSLNGRMTRTVFIFSRDEYFAGSTI